MEMWCPDDIGRDSWDWVGPPAWVRACLNSPEWGGGSSPVKTEPHQIVLLLLLLLLFCGVVFRRRDGEGEVQEEGRSKEAEQRQKKKL